jgi:hypothetical protein
MPLFFLFKELCGCVKKRGIIIYDGKLRILCEKTVMSLDNIGP